jgi:hypothetical protein
VTNPIFLDCNPIQNPGRQIFGWDPGLSRKLYISQAKSHK